MKSQATRCTQKQLAYLAYWQARGYTFGRDDVIPECTMTPPPSWHMPRKVDLIATAVVLAVIACYLRFTY
jgi:hypothetical protein